MNPHAVRFPQLRAPGWLEAQWAAGKTASMIAGELGCSVALVARVAKRRGLPRHRHVAARYSDNQIRLMRELVAKTRELYSCGQLFDVRHSKISAIVRGDLYARAPGPILHPGAIGRGPIWRVGKKLRSQAVACIKAELETGTTVAEVARAFGCSEGNVRDIRRGAIWSDVPSAYREDSALADVEAAA